MSRKPRRPHPVFLGMALIVLTGLPGVAGLWAQTPQPSQTQVRALYLSSFAADSPDTTLVVDALKKALVSQGSRPEVYVESLDAFRLRQTEESTRVFEENLDKRFEGLRFSIILAQASDGLRVAVRYKQGLDYAVPVYCFDWIDDDLIQQYSAAAGFYGRPLAMSFPATLNLALTLFPKTRRAYLLASPLDSIYVPTFLRDLEAAQGAHPSVDLVPLVNTDFESTRHTLEKAPDASVTLLLPGSWLLGTGEFLGGQAARDRLAAASPMPYFAITKESLGSGLVGGAFANREQMGVEAAQMIQAILGHQAALVPWQSSGALVPSLDHRALETFSVPRASVPVGAEILFEPPPLWIRYEFPLKVTGVFLVVLVVILLVMAVVRSNELRRANGELRTLNENVLRAMDDLKAAESRLVVSEKLAALGRLTANTSHELNSPLAAISAASSAITDYLGRGLGNVFGGPLTLDGDVSRFFHDVLSRSSQPGAPLPWASPRGERLARDQAEAILRASGVPDPYPLADELMELGVADLASRAAPFLAGGRGPIFMAILRATLGALRASVIVEDSVAKASRIVASFGIYALSTEETTPSLVPVHLVTQEVIGLHNLRPHRNVEVRNLIHGELTVFVRRNDLLTMLFNLLKNAVQAVDGVGTITLSAVPAGQNTQIRVEDTGPGIPPELQNRIFEPFFSTRAIGEGAGIGLDVSRRLAQRNGGDLRFQSVPGQTVFFLELPTGAPVVPEVRNGT